MRTTVAVSFLLCLCACSTPQYSAPKLDPAFVAQERERQLELLVERRQDMNSRLQNVAYKLRKDNVDLCGDNAREITGIEAFNIRNIDEKEMRAPWTRLYGLDKRVRITNVIDGSPAQIAGLLVGDIIISINGEEVKTGRGATKSVNKRIDKIMKQGTPLDLVVERDGQEKTFEIQGKRVCGYGVVFEDSDEVNAFANGKEIILTRGMMKFVENDEELALIVGHELAHNLAGHIDATRTNAVIGGLGGLVVDLVAAGYGVNTEGTFTDMGMRIGASAYSVEFEQEADYLGLYLMERAGYDSSDVARFWRRMAIDESSAITHSSTHPTTPERFLGIEATYSEIEEKRQARVPLFPEKKAE